MRLTLTCPSCGATWDSQTTSGRTRCGDARVYVPLAERRAAGLARGPITAPHPRAAPRRLTVPARVESQPVGPPEPPPRRQVPPLRAPGGPSPFAMLASTLATIAGSRAASRRASPSPSPVPSPRVPVPPAPAPPPVVPPASVDRRINGPPYGLEVTCGCLFGWDTPQPPSTVVCPSHGPVMVRSMTSAERWPGVTLRVAIPATTP